MLLLLAVYKMLSMLKLLNKTKTKKKSPLFNRKCHSPFRVPIYCFIFQNTSLHPREKNKHFYNILKTILHISTTFISCPPILLSDNPFCVLVLSNSLFSLLIVVDVNAQHIYVYTPHTQIHTHIYCWVHLLLMEYSIQSTTSTTQLLHLMLRKQCRRRRRKKARCPEHLMILSSIYKREAAP